MEGPDRLRSCSMEAPEALGCFPTFHARSLSFSGPLVQNCRHLTRWLLCLLRSACLQGYTTSYNGLHLTQALRFWFKN